MTSINLELQELEKFYDLMLPAQEKNQKAFIWFSGIPHPLFNAVMHLISKQPKERVESIISGAPHHFPISFWVHQLNGTKHLGEILKEKGFQSLMTCTLMAWGVKTIACQSNQIQLADLDTFHDLLGTTFHFSEEVKQGYAALLKNIEAENYIITYDSEPAGTGTLIPHGKIGGIFNIATHPEYQKRGCGTTIMQFLMSRASILGLKKLVLLSSPAGKNLYSKLGFENYLGIEIYARA